MSVATKKRVVHNEQRMNLAGANVRLHIFKTVDSNNEVKIPITNVIDPFESYYGVPEDATDELTILQPPYDLNMMAQMSNISNMLRRCVDAYATNIDGFGYQLSKADYIKGLEKEPVEVQTERQRLKLLFDYCNPDQNITQLRQDLTRDKENVGFSCMEIVRNRIHEIAELYDIPAYSIRLTSKDKDVTSYTEKVRTDDGQFVLIPRNKRFRRIVQYFGVGQKNYFKEFGDPRPISRKTGKVNKNDPQANEVIIFNNDVTYGNYGVPRYIGSILAIIGNRKAEEVNLLFFDNKTIPPMIVLVSGGQLSEESLKLLKETLEKETKGIDNFHKSIWLEGIPHSTSTIEGEKISPMKIDVKPLTQFIQSDATFQKYKSSNEVDIREDFRLPPIFVGASDDYTRATANESVKVAENLVFKPERKKFDDIINRKVLSDMQISTLTFESVGPKISDSTFVLRALGRNANVLPIGVFLDIVMDSLGEERLQIEEQIYNTPIAFINRISELFGIKQSILLPFQENEDDEDEDEDDIEKQSGTIEVPSDASDETIEKFVKYLIKVKDRLNKKFNLRITKGDEQYHVIQKPLPTPRKNEKKKDFIQRFMSNKSMTDEYSDVSQRRAIAESQWDRKKK